jgi:predicted ATPase
MSLTFLSLRDFKCHAELDLPLAPLTILTGLNSAGKSSVLHALSLLGQSIRDGGHSSRPEFLLNGDLVRLGTIGDVQNQTTDHQTFRIALRDGTSEISWCLAGERRDTKATLKEGVFRALDGSLETTFQDVSLRDNADNPMVTLLRDMEFLTILRRDPADMPFPVEGNFENRIGALGEGAVPLLYLNDQTHISSTLRIENVPPTLPRQVEAWMQHFFPGFAMDIQPMDSAADVMVLRIRTDLAGEFHMPANVGYGPYYALPVVAAALSRAPGQLLMIDSPEAHLHPSCQSEIGKFLAKVAATGVQVIVETHNDHFINGARQAVKDKTIAPPESVLLHYFGASSPDDDAHAHSTIAIDSGGALDQWPRGFCDQYELDLARLADWK